MALVVATHSGPFHADDVTAVALIHTFVDADAVVVRSRDASVLATADLVVDVGGIFEPDRGRFDHHQASYQGSLSSAGMVLDWLRDRGAIDAELHALLRSRAVDYVDAVDTGRRAPERGVPCLASVVEVLNAPARDAAGYDGAFLAAVGLVRAYLAGMLAEHDGIREARQVVPLAMAAAAAEGRNVLVLDAHLKWKPVYFEHGGETHPTEFALFPGTDGSWRVVAIPPRLGEFGQKRSLPRDWAGLSGSELEAVSGIPGALFCHKNRFIAAFASRQAAEQALRGSGLWLRSRSCPAA